MITILFLLVFCILCSIAVYFIAPFICDIAESIDKNDKYLELRKAQIEISDKEFEISCLRFEISLMKAVNSLDRLKISLDKLEEALTK